MGKYRTIKKIFHSRFFIFSVIFSLVLLLSSEAIPNRVEFDSDKEFKPVVKVKEGRDEVPAAQKEQFEKLIEEGKRLFQEEMDYEGAIRKFEEAKLYSVTRIQKADIFFYLSLVYYATQEEAGLGEVDKAIRKQIELDYYRELDKSICPPKYIELFQGVKREYGALKVQSNPPGADVYLNDSKEPVGKTPLTIGSRAGAVKVRVKKGRKEKKEILNVIAGTEIATSVFVLKGISALTVILGGLVLAYSAGAAAILLGKLGNGGGTSGGSTTGSILVSSSPTGAQVFLDGSNTGQTTNCTLTDVSSGSHTVRVVREGYEDYEESVSVTAGQTATVSATLTRITITITDLTSSTVWTTGEEIEIKWQTSGSSGVSTGAGLDPLIHHGRNVLDPFQRRAFQNRNSQDSDARERGELENSGTTEKFVILSGKQSKLQGVSNKFSSSARAGDIFHRRAKDIRDIRSMSRVGIINAPVAPQISNDKFIPSGDIRILALSYVKIDLYKGSTFNQTIESSTENDGSYMWTVDSSLEDGTDYKVRISSTSDSGVYGESSNFEIQDSTPAVPSDLDATAISSGEIDLSWTDNSNNESGFKIERKTGASGTWSEVGTVNADVETYQDTGIEAETTYYYRVRAYNASGDSDYSNEASASTSEAVPAAPSDLDATAISPSEIDLSWTDNSNNESGFKIERKTGASGDWSEVDTVNAEVTTYQDTGIEAETTYYYRVRAYNASGDSDYSNEANASTSEAVPAAPSDLDATAVSSGEIDLSWTDNSNNESGFKIERKTGASGSWSEVDTVNAEVTTYQDTGVEAETTYYYRVRAYNAAGDSGYSNEASASTSEAVPAAPSDLNATAIPSGEIDLSWTDNSNNESGFKIEHKTGTSGTWSEVDTVNADVTTYQDTGVEAETTYYYRVRAYNASGDSGYSNEANATTVRDIEWVQIPAGSFEMGDNFNEGGSDERPVHTVYLDTYYISKYEVTFEQYDAFCDATGRSKPDDFGWGRADRPVMLVTWDETKAFCDWLSDKTGENIHLPTEAQWEKAARGTDQRKYPWGNNSPDNSLANYNNNEGKTMPVGSYPSGVSPYGIHDMAGNVHEWCSDWYDADYYSSSPTNNPQGPSSGSYRLKRGGSWWRRCERPSFRLSRPQTRPVPQGQQCRLPYLQVCIYGEIYNRYRAYKQHNLGKRQVGRY